jgi:hypothetical protein
MIGAATESAIAISAAPERCAARADDLVFLLHGHEKNPREQGASLHSKF